MTPVCPACRAPVRLDDHACGRCGLAMRPTCGTCGEPLMYGMTSCRFCRELIDGSPEEPRSVTTVSTVVPVDPSAGPTASSSVATARLQAVRPVTPPAVRPSVPVFPERRHMSAGRAFVVWFVATIGLVATMLAMEIGMPRFPGIAPASIDLKRHAFPAFGFSISSPTDWDVNEKKASVSFLARENRTRDATRGLRVTPTAVRFEDVDDRAEPFNRRRVEDYRPLATDRATLDGHDARVFVFAGNDLRFEQWWVDSGKETLRLEFLSRLADDAAAAANARIARSLRLL